MENNVPGTGARTLVRSGVSKQGRPVACQNLRIIESCCGIKSALRKIVIEIWHGYAKLWLVFYL